MEQRKKEAFDLAMMKVVKEQMKEKIEENERTNGEKNGGKNKEAILKIENNGKF